MSTPSKIDYRFKILYAVGIVMITAGHTYGGGITLFNYWFPFFGFHLALFAFCSGYFYNSSAETDLKLYVIKKIKKLIIPLYVYNIVYGLFTTAVHQFGFTMGDEISLYTLFIAPIKNGHQFAYNLGGWFLIPLFMLEMVNVIVRKVIHRFGQVPEWIFFIASLALGIVGNRISYLGYNQEWWVVLDRFLYFLPFFGAGIFYRRVFEKYDKRIPSFWYFVVLIAIRLAIAYHYNGIPTLIPSWCNDFPANPLLPIILGYTGIAFWMRIACIIEPVIGKSKYVNLLADNTFSIMMNQFLGFFLVNAIYAAGKTWLGIFSAFDISRWKTDLWYYYLPNEVNQTLIIYLVFGIAIPILIQKIINATKTLIFKRI